MNLTDARQRPQKRFRDWLRVMRPLSWWVILVLILYTIRTHLVLLQETRLTFEPSIEGRPEYITATLDGKPISNGAQISIGKHRITFAHRKAEALTTNILVWYGGYDLADVVLKRNRGVIAVSTAPAVQLLTIVGPEFRMQLTNSTGFTSSVPTDPYLVGANWLNHGESNRIKVMTGNQTLLHYSPSLGTVGIFTEPEGARVIGKDGGQIGVTPLVLAEVRAGNWNGEVRLDGFIPANVRLRVLAHETNSFRTNLVSWQYAQAFEDARRWYAAHEYDRAIESAEAALKANSAAGEAKALRDDIIFAECMQRGQSLLKGSRYTDARKVLEAALRIQPENNDAKALLATASKREEEVAFEENRKQAQQLTERIRRERLNDLDSTMSAVTHEHLDGTLFEVQKLTFTNSIKEVGVAIQKALLRKSPAFEVEKFNWQSDHLFVIQAKQDAYGGLRRCLIIGTQATENESAVLFRMLEYETHLNVNLGGVLRISDGQPPLVAVPNRKDRVTEGIQSMIERIKTSANSD